MTHPLNISAETSRRRIVREYRLIDQLAQCAGWRYILLGDNTSGVRAYLHMVLAKRAQKIATMNGLRPVGRPPGKDPQFFESGIMRPLRWATVQDLEPTTMGNRILRNWFDGLEQSLRGDAALAGLLGHGTLIGRPQ